MTYVEASDSRHWDSWKRLPETLGKPTGISQALVDGWMKKHPELSNPIESAQQALDAEEQWKRYGRPLNIAWPLMLIASLTLIVTSHQFTNQQLSTGFLIVGVLLAIGTLLVYSRVSSYHMPFDVIRKKGEARAFVWSFRNLREAVSETKSIFVNDAWYGTAQFHELIKLADGVMVFHAKRMNAIQKEIEELKKIISTPIEVFATTNSGARDLLAKKQSCLIQMGKAFNVLAEFSLAKSGYEPYFEMARADERIDWSQID